MKSTPLFAALLALPALAQAPLAQERWQVGFGFNGRQGSEVEYQNGANQFLRFKPKAGYAPTLQVGCRVLDLDHSHLTLTGEYQFRTRTEVEVTNIGGAASGLPGGMSTHTSHSQYWAPGISWDFRRTMDFGFGLQYRFTRLEGDGTKASHDRPWLSAYVGHTFRSRSKVKPFVALRHAIALNSSSKPGFESGAGEAARKQLLRALDGDSELALQVGVRF